MPGTRVRLVAVLALAPLASAYALDPQRATSQYVVTKWGRGNLPSNTIHAVLQTRDRYLWLGTTAGLVRFDGASFTVFNALNSPGFGDGGAYRLAEAADGSLYVGTTSGTVVRYKDGVFTRQVMQPGTAAVTSLLAARDGSIWIGMHGQHLQRLRDGKATVFSRPGTMQAPFAIAEDGGGTIWIGTRDSGLMRYRGGDSFERLDVTSDLIQALGFDRRGMLWIGTAHGLLRLEGKSVLRLTEDDGLSHKSVSAILEDRDGNLWVGTAGGGLNRLHDGHWTHLTTPEGLTDDDVRCLLEDHEGNLWVGTADGLNCLSNGRFITYGRLEGLHEHAVASVAGSADGSVWVGTTTGTVTRLKDGHVEHFDLPEGVGREAPIVLYEARDRTLWISLDNGRLFRLKDGVISEITLASGPRKVRAIYEDDGGVVLVVASYGPSRLVGRQMVPMHTGLPDLRYVHAAYRDPLGALWIGSLMGLGRFSQGRWRLFTQADGLPANRVRWISGEPDGSLWAATTGGLAYVRKDETISKVTIQQGLPENYLRLVLDDGLGYLWVASMGHIFRLEKKELLDLFAGRRRLVSPVIFDTSDGLRSTETLYSNTPGFRAADGRLWFATAKGVSVVDPSRVRTDDPAPPVNIGRVTVDGVTERLDEYRPGRGEVTIEYTARSYRAPHKIHFRHRLEGLDKDWVDVGLGRRAYYSNLPPGRYRFSVMACNHDGNWNGEAEVLAFAIRPPFHRTPLFYALCVALVAAVVAAGHRFRVNQMRGRFAGIIKERTRIARELHDTLAQGLAGVKFQIDTAMSTMTEKPDVARESIRFAGSMITSSLAEVRRSIWVLRAQAAKGEDGLGASLEGSLRQLTADTGLKATVRVGGSPRPLPAELEHNLLRIAHEAVINAVRHSGATRLDVDLQFRDASLELCVKDDGRGFDPDACLRGSRGEHFGLLGISERAQAMGGELQVRSRVGEGTEVSCSLPYDSPMDPAGTETIEGASL